jgi:Kef-type K+ transport system membrane component KefB
MAASEFGSFTLLLVLLVGIAHLLGHAFTRLRQPRVIGEILAGVVLGPAILGRFAPGLSVALFGVVSSGATDNKRYACVARTEQLEDTV